MPPNHYTNIKTGFKRKPCSEATGNTNECPLFSMLIVMKQKVKGSIWWNSIFLVFYKSPFIKITDSSVIFLQLRPSFNYSITEIEKHWKVMRNLIELKSCKFNFTLKCQISWKSCKISEHYAIRTRPKIWWAI